MFVQQFKTSLVCSVLNYSDGRPPLYKKVSFTQYPREDKLFLGMPSDLRDEI